MEGEGGKDAGSHGSCLRASDSHDNGGGKVMAKWEGDEKEMIRE